MNVALLLASYPQLDESWNSYAPLGLGYLASYAQQRLGGVEFIADHRSGKIIEAKPDCVGVSFTSYNARYAAQEARKIKDALNCPVIAGGIHVSAIPELLDPVFDCGVMGEGEETFVELLRLFQERKALPPALPPATLAAIQGLAYRNEAGVVVRTPPRPHIEQLDQIGFPDRVLLQKRGPWSPEYVSFMTSRGCPYNCHFCSSKSHWGGRIRYHSVEHVLRECEGIASQFDPRQVFVFDDLFIANKERAKRILSGMRERRLFEGKDLRCFVRSNHLDDEIMQELVATGFRILCMGFESASEPVLEALNKRPRMAFHNRQAVELARKHGALFSASFILGTPGETRDDILETFNFIESNAGVFLDVNVSFLMAFPGSKAWEWANPQGITDRAMVDMAISPEDIENEKDAILRRLPYLNEANVPREELYAHLQTARLLAKSVAQSSQLRRDKARLESALAQAHTPQYVAQAVPIRPVLWEKIKRRLFKKRTG